MAERIRHRQGDDLDWELKRFRELQHIQAEAARQGFIGKEVDTTNLAAAQVADVIWKDLFG